MIAQLDLVKRYLLYRLTGQNRHHLQSPFNYNLNEAVFRRDRKPEAAKAIEARRKQLLNDQRVINVRDFGAGFGGKQYKQLGVSFITKRSSKPGKYARLLYRLVQYFKPQHMLELGTSVGISALYQSAGNPNGVLYTIEGCEETDAIARESFAAFPHLNIQQRTGAFSEVLPSVLEEMKTVDYLFIDGHHQLEPTLQYFEQCLPYLSEKAVIVIDDINWSEGMREAWRRLQEHPRVTVSIDLFMLGVLLVDPDLSKERFRIGY